MEIPTISISIIIPVYNVEKYIERCARSLFEQSMTAGIEFIFVDDCTQDNSIQILKKTLTDYPRRASQTRIIHHPENKGLPASRKTGIDVALGQYIAHCDSDDWVEPDTYRLIIEKAKTENLDMVICNNYVMDHKGIEHIRLRKICDGQISSASALKFLLTGEFAAGIVQKVVRRDYYGLDLIDPVSNMAEDLLLSTQLCWHCRRIGLISKPLYHYRYNPNSLSRKISESDTIKRCLDYTKNIDLMIGFLKSVNIYDCYKYDISSFKLQSRGYLMPYIEKNYRLWKEIYPELDTWEYFGKLSLKQKIKYLVIRLHLYKLYPLLQNVSRRLRSV